METKKHLTGLEGTPLGDAVAKRETTAGEPEKKVEEEKLREARLAAMKEDRIDREEEVEKIARRK